MNNNTITIRDIGPHSNLEIHCLPGVNVISGFNEAGKSIAIRCVAALAGGDAKGLPIRDGSACGMVSGFGTTISVGMRTQKAGELRDAEPLSERIDLATLVDPRLKDRAAANKHRVRALLTLTKKRLSFEDFRKVLPEDRQAEISADFDSTDPVELAGAIKREMEKRARRFSEDADEAASTAKALLAAIDGIDADSECDEVELRRAHQTAVEKKAKIEAEINSARLSEHRYKSAAAKLESVAATNVGEIDREYKDRCAASVEAGKAHAAAREALAKAQAELDRTERAAIAAARAEDDQRRVLEAAKKECEAVAELREIVQHGPGSGPTMDELEAAIVDVKAAEEAVANGVAIRRAAEKREAAKEYLKKQEAAYAVSQVYRQAAASTDTVLTEAVDSEYFAVKGGELFAEDREGVLRPFAELSEGARYKIAIKAVAESVEGDAFYFVPLDQNAWDGLNSESRAEVARTAVEHNVAIVTGEISDDELTVYHFGGQLVTA
jgi:DNA repair ATPase RecN